MEVAAETVGEVEEASVAGAVLVIGVVGAQEVPVEEEGGAVAVVLVVAARLS